MKTIWLILLTTLCTITAGVYFAVQSRISEEPTLSVLRVGVLPDQSVEALRKRYAPLLEYLSATTGLDTKLVTPSDYNSLIRMFRDDEVELAYFGGLTFVQAHTFYDAEPLVMRNKDSRFTSWFLVKSGDTSSVLTDFKGKKFSFGSSQSTSGHLMPRYFMGQEKQIIAEDFFSEVRYSGSHDKTAYLVRDGEVDLGVANSEIIRSMIRDGRLKENDLRVLWESPPYSDYVWTVHDHLDEGIKTQLRDAFLGLNAYDVDHGKVLAAMSAENFLPAVSRDFLTLKQTAATLELLEPHIK